MTVQNTTNRITYAGNGVTTSFSTSPVVFFDTTDLTVYVTVDATGVVTTLIENTDYTVTGGSGAVGTVSLAGGSVPYGAPASGTTLIIVRELSVVQSVDFQNNELSDAEVLEEVVDKLTMIAQQNSNAIERTIRYPNSAVATVDLELPTPTAGDFLAWNSTQDGLENVDPGDVALAVPADASVTAAKLADAVFSGLTAVTIASGDYVAIADTSDSSKKKKALVSSILAAAACRGFIDGCKIANGTDATNDLNVSAGQCMDSTNAVVINVAAMAGKQLDANWAPGAAAGMRNSGVAIANGTYHIYAVAKADGTQDIYAHTSTTVATVITALQAESGGASYVYARRVASIVRAGATILQFTQYGDRFELVTPVLDIDVTNPGTSAVTRTLASMPTGLALRALMYNEIYCTATTFSHYVTSLAQTDGGAGGGSNVLKLAYANDLAACYVEATTNTSAQIRTRSSASDAAAGVRILSIGWVDTRGRDA